MRRRRFNPALNKRFVETIDGYDVYTVDAFALRNASQADEEFDNVAVHDDFPDVIPEGVIWTARSTWKTEGRFFVANAVAELKAKEAGKSAKEAFDAGNRADRRLRHEVTGIRYRNGKPHRRVPSQIYKGSYQILADPEFPIGVRLIDGLMVRCFYKTDYTEGGHGYVYRWCPHQEIWIEKSIVSAERPYIVAHEYIELRLMRDEGLEYDRAHEICSEMEFDLRQAARRSQFPGLSRRQFQKADLALLTTHEFFEYVRRNYVKSLRRRVRAFVSDLASQIIPV